MLKYLCFQFGCWYVEVVYQKAIIEESLEFIPGGLTFGRLYITSATTVGHNWKYLLKVVVVIVLVLLGLSTGVWCFLFMDGKLFSQCEEWYVESPNCNINKLPMNAKNIPHNHLWCTISSYHLSTVFIFQVYTGSFHSFKCSVVSVLWVCFFIKEGKN